MAVFPKTESGITDLATQMVTGLTDHADLYPSVTGEAKTELTVALANYTTARSSQAEAAAAAKNATILKNDRQTGLE